ERIVLEERLFAHFPDQLAKDWGFEPILTAFWATVLEQAQRTNLLGERFVSARRQWERRWGCRNLEVPVSRVAQTEVFAWFACHLLTDLPRFHAIHNESVRTYRRAHRIRSTNHPVPDLAQDADWLETPFWAWRAGDARRGRLMSKRSGAKIELRVGEQSWPALPLSAQHAVTTCHKLILSSLKLRPPA